MRRKGNCLKVYALVLVAGLLVLTGGVFCEEEKPRLKLEIALEKDAFLLGEPIIIKATLANLTGEPLKLKEPEAELRFVKYEVFSLKDAATLPNAEWYPAAPPGAYAFPLQAGESLCRYWSLFEDHHRGIPLGDYTVEAKYSPFEKWLNPNLWHGEIKSNKIAFKIVKDDSQLARGYEQFQKALDTYITRGRHASEPEFLKVLEVAPVMECTRLVPYFLAGIECRKKDYQRAVSYYKEFLQANPSYPYYSDHARCGLAGTLMRLGRFSEADAVIRELPDGYLKMAMLNSKSRQLKRFSKKP